MNSWTELGLQMQFMRAVASGWMPFFETAASGHSLAPELLLAIASRETGMRNIKGDLRNGVYHGYGIMQVDIGSFPEFCKTWTSDMVKESIECGSGILASKRDYLASHQITDLRSLAAAYNTGEGNVRKSYEQKRDVDSTTTGGNYGADVIRRMQVFANLLKPPAPNAA